ncbi:Endoribonuclease L-PSP/chorismate mutase-like protein [Piptocephalis cylindrospora]|uniref:Endoribonuclease L-PSP/chorismate mutase-like protein n=1 Tax=Piptocephalis cylindrospora TaxID=1907219 RepID=A0A4P9Y209_9FUNG|nr:Endoribonuclease L-PSP/chorismate mutase-like protein [Piptocephalis cylindrospora]|eukprot:RKP12582.1 Endoribonuclease L-PSP/chorismate mutase-like protein [Piptocephalis cylindrospora]
MSSPNGKAIILKNKAGALAAYPHARVVGGLVYLSGISSRRPDNTYEGAVQKDDGQWALDIEAQTRAVLENIRAILEEAGSSLDHLIDITVFLVDMDVYDGFNAVYNTYFKADTGPSRTTVAVKQLPCKAPNRLLIEIKGIAAVKRI